jgi:hypothetical protein
VEAHRAILSATRDSDAERARTGETVQLLDMIVVGKTR